MDELPEWANETPEVTAPRTIRIFLASSDELLEDRNEFERYFRQQNDEAERGFYLKIERWENFRDAMSSTRLQDEYNEAIRNCDIFVCLAFTKVGRFTEEEFDVAHQQFMSNGSPLIYTYFKDDVIETGSANREGLKSRWAFEDKLRKLGHFGTNYKNIEHLKCQFSDQLVKVFGKIRAY
jgi:hypothetical protein